MNRLQVEAKALELVDRVRAGRAIEYDHVELKGEWVDPVRAARRLAAHANTARGEPIIWLIGVDERDGVKKINDANMAAWWPAVQQQFDQLAPSLLHHLVVPIDGDQITVLVWDTSAFPYVVRNPVYGQPGAGPVQLEVPWREGANTRSARREDLVRMLAPIQLQPSLEIRSAALYFLGAEPGPLLRLHAHVYIVPGLNTRMVFPFHQCEAIIRDAGNQEIVMQDLVVGAAQRLLMPERGPRSVTILASEWEVVVDGPGMVFVRAEAPEPSSLELPAVLTLRFGAAGMNAPAVITAALHRVNNEGNMIARMTMSSEKTDGSV